MEAYAATALHDLFHDRKLDVIALCAYLLLLFGNFPQVLERTQRELLDLGGSHLSILEMSHRSPEFMAIVDDTVAKAKKLL